MEKTRTIKVATLNYCDIMNNPFEFYCDDFAKELADISNTFQRIIPTYFPNFDKNKFKWDMGKIDQKIRVGRYSPCFALYVGIKNDRFMSRQEFELKWDQQFEKITKIKEVEFIEAQKNTTRLYDFILFHALLAYAFKKDDFNELIKNPPDLYIDIYRPFYELSFLSQEKKMKKFFDNFDSINADVFFMQEFSMDLMKRVEAGNRFHVAYDDGNDKLILARKTIFKTKTPTKDLLSKEQIASLEWSKEPSAILISDNFIMINIHLSSKEEKNKPQVDKMRRSLEELKTKLPRYNFIVAGDVNSFMGHDPEKKFPVFEQFFNFYPLSSAELTTIKKRTMSQGQFHKGNLPILQSKDKVMSTLKIKNGAITYISKKPASKDSLIPTDEHPFDHFLITADLIWP